VKAYGDDTLVRAVLDDYASADIEPRLKTTLAFLHKVTLRPAEVTPDDVTPLREAGLSDEAIEEAIGVCTCFNVIVRIADAFDFEVSDTQDLPWIGRAILGLGYTHASLPG